MMKLLLVVFLGSLLYVEGLNNGLGRVPQMGWNSWNHYGCGINESIMKQTIVAVASTGLRDAGYTFVNVDDCWAGSRNSTGYIQPDPSSFPNGMAPLAALAHQYGLKFGLYSDAGTKTCAGRPGSLGYETQDATSYASWNVDYLKYDNCNNENIPPETRYPVMRNALNATGHPIFFSMCEWGQDNPATWAVPVGNSWRTTTDIQDNWTSMMSNINNNNNWASYAAPGGWNDPDMLEVGNGGMTTTEYTTHFSLWCLAKAPLLIGCDVTHLSQDTIEILTNPEAIAVNQDPLGIQGKIVATNGSAQIWAGALTGKAYAVILLNTGSSTQTITATWQSIGLNPSSTFQVRDLWARANRGVYSNSYSASVPSHGVAFVKLTPTSLRH